MNVAIERLSYTRLINTLYHQIGLHWQSTQLCTDIAYSPTIKSILSANCDAAASYSLMLASYYLQRAKCRSQVDLVCADGSLASEYSERSKSASLA